MKPSCRARFVKGTFEMTWELAGQMLEVCNCGLLCPCWMDLTAQPDRGWCGTALLFDIERGNVGGLDVAGRKVVMAAEIPGAFANGNFTVRLYVDEGASAEQLRALEQLFTGQLGGPMAALGPAVTTLLPTRVARIMVQHGEIVTAMVSEAGRLQWAPRYDPGAARRRSKRLKRWPPSESSRDIQPRQREVSGRIPTCDHGAVIPV
jgi:hypothetical protein